MPEKIRPMDALLYLPQPLVIVTAGDYEDASRRGGMTAAWVSRVSWSPPLLIVSIVPSRHTLELIKEYGEFVVNVVGKTLENAAYGVFGTKSGKIVDKFVESGVKARRGEKTRAPVLEDAVIAVECRLVKTVEAGDHILVVGEVVNAIKFSDEPPSIFMHAEFLKRLTRPGDTRQ
ncbi:MAG: flavin reductase family protein [Thermoproteota archaeon]